MRSPNILIVFADTQRADTVHALSNDAIRAPQLDRLAREGTAFTNAYMRMRLAGAVTALMAFQAAWVACGAGGTQQRLRLAPLLRDHMVFQRDMPAPVWGWTDAGRTVTVEIAGQKRTCTSDTNGAWRLTLNPLPTTKADKALTLTVCDGVVTQVVRDVVVGEVWVCSGQSNMEWPVRAAANADAEVMAADYPNIRTFVLDHVRAVVPATDCSGSWRVCTPVSAGFFSAAGFYFGRHLHKQLDGVPVGLVVNPWSGMIAEPYTPISTLRTNRRGYSIDRRGMPREPVTPVSQNAGGPGGIFNAMVAPLIPHAIRGAIWYQGESNTGRAWQYRRLLPTMIEGWRKEWGQGDFPFLIVQLANHMAVNPAPAESAWAELREAQALTAHTLTNCGLAVAIDIGDAADIHPRNKQDVGRRLGLSAEKIAYGRDLVFSGPVYESATVEDGKMRLKFRHVGGGLMASGEGGLKGFAVAGEDKKFAWADAAIDGATVVVSNANVPAPVAARYAWADNPVCNLYNREGLPAVPFRTDNWPVTTQPKN